MKTPWLPTFTGRRFRPLDPKPGDVTIADIAHGLAAKYRFSGQGLRYTVAQHSVEVSKRVPRQDAVWGLLHDAAEAWLPDVAAPIKPFLCFLVPDDGQTHKLPFDTVEQGILRAVAERFGLDWPMPPSIDEVDHRMAVTERRDLFEHEYQWEDYRGVPSYEDRIVPWGPNLAESEFLRRFRDLVPGVATRAWAP
jgi:hypothetical protein